MDFTNKLIDWYRLNKRHLPWRQTSDPYRIWVSEVILQQTRVDQGLSYYERFLQKFPDIQTLADAGDDDVLKSWQGLGYYSRARNLHAAAQQLVKEHGGHFPENYDEILSLKGVGEYSASAIASIAYNLKYPVVDGNVLRFMARFYGIEIPVNSGKGKKLIREKLEKLISSDEPGTFNQAMMEFGATVCKPQQALCKICVFQEDCVAFRTGKVKDLPVKVYKPIVKKRFFHYLLVLENENNSFFTYINKRTEDDIWKNLYDFPLIEMDKIYSVQELERTERWKAIFSENSPRLIFQSRKFLHKLSHQELHIQFFVFQAEGFNKNDYTRLKADQISNYPVPRLIEIFLDEYIKKILTGELDKQQ